MSLSTPIGQPLSSICHKSASLPETVSNACNWLRLADVLPRRRTHSLLNKIRDRR
jgi:hypothetical protein